MNPREKQVVVVTEETYAPEVDKNCNALGDQLCLLPQGNHVGHGCILEVAWQLQTLADMHCIPRGPGGVGMALDHSQGLIEVRALSDGGAHPQHHRGLWHDGGNVPGVPVQRVGTVGVAIAGIGPDSPWTSSQIRQTARTAEVLAHGLGLLSGVRLADGICCWHGPHER